MNYTSLAQLTLNKTPKLAGEAWPHLTQHLPLSLAVREIMRLRALFEMGVLKKPILDVGCGDGLFWENLILSLKEGENISLQGLMGIDINPNELSLASLRLKTKGGEVFQQDISLDQPIRNSSLRNLKDQFQTVIANCSLEHIPHLEPALLNIRQYLHRNGLFVLFVPTPHWTDNLKFKNYFQSFSPRLAGLIGGCFDGFFQHRHLYPANVWRFLLEGMGFKVQTILGLGHPLANQIFEKYLLRAFLAFIIKGMIKKYPRVSFPFLSNQKIIQEFLTLVDEGQIIQSDLTQSYIIEYFIICHK